MQSHREESPSPLCIIVAATVRRIPPGREESSELVPKATGTRTVLCCGRVVVMVTLPTQGGCRTWAPVLDSGHSLAHDMEVLACLLGGWGGGYGYGCVWAGG